MLGRAPEDSAFPLPSSAGSAPRTAVAAGQDAVLSRQETRIGLALVVRYTIDYEEATRRRAASGPGTVASVVGNPERTPAPQKIELETSAEYAAAGDFVIATHLCLRTSFPDA